MKWVQSIAICISVLALLRIALIVTGVDDADSTLQTFAIVTIAAYTGFRFANRKEPEL